VHREHHDVTGPLGCQDALGQAFDAALRQIREIIHARPVRLGGPLSRHAAALEPHRKDEHAAVRAHGKLRWRFGLHAIFPGARSADARAVKRVERLFEPRLAPVQHVVVGEHTAVDAGGGQAIDVGRVHPVVDALVDPVAAAGHGRFQIDDAGVRLHARQLVQGVAPDVPGSHRTRDGPVALLRQTHIVHGVLHPRLVDGGIARVRQDLVDPPAGHHVAADEQSELVHRPIMNPLVPSRLTRINRAAHY
jgi:hypothetical protein